jgi:signal transduction histidine kinase
MSNGTVITGASPWQQGLLPVGETLSGRHVSALLDEVKARIEEIVDGTRERMNALLRSVIAVSSGLDLDETLRQITEAAIELVDARYGALGVFAEDGTISQFIYVHADETDVTVPVTRNGTRSGEHLRQDDAQIQNGALIEDARRLLLDDLAKNPLSAGFTANGPSTRRFLGVPVLARGEVYGRLVLTEKHQGAGLTADDETVVRALAGAAGIAVDNSRLYQKAHRHRRWLEATAEVTTQLLGGGDADGVLTLIAQHALDLTGADYTLIALPDGAEKPVPNIAILTVAVCVGMGADTIIGKTMPISGSTAGEVFADQIAQNVDALTYDLAEGLGIEFGPALALPLGVGESLAGVLLTVRTPGSLPFDELEMQMVSLFAAQAMLALERAEIQATRRELQALAERDRIAQDLHDHVIQRLFAVGLAMESTQQLAKTPTVSDRLADHVDQVYAVIGEIRSAIFDLQAGTGANFQLRTTLHQVITELTADTDIRTAVRISGPLDALPTDLIPHVLAVVREAVSNAVRHSRAQDLTVTISMNADLIAIDVMDNGIGIPDTIAHSGLHNLDQRASSTGGTCSVHRNDQGGTRLSWSAPLTTGS